MLTKHRLSSSGEKTRTGILKVLSRTEEAMGAARIAAVLATRGQDVRPRTVREHLRHLDEEHLTELVSRRAGRVITVQGREELSRVKVTEKIGTVAAKLDTLGYQMTFRNSRGAGTVILNVCLIKRCDLSRAQQEMRPVFERGLTMGNKMVIAQPGDRLGGIEIPSGFVAIGTVCSVSINGILLGESIPVTCRFAGLLEIRQGESVRFVDLIEYRGTTLDPLETFVKAGMTRVRDCARTGSGLVGASFREIPAAAIHDIGRIKKDLAAHGLDGILLVGKPNQPLLDIPVDEGRAGMIVIGGLNPIAALHEAQIDVSICSLAGLHEYSTLVSYDLVC